MLNIEQQVAKMQPLESGAELVEPNTILLSADGFVPKFVGEKQQKYSDDLLQAFFNKKSIYNEMLHKWQAENGSQMTVMSFKEGDTSTTFTFADGFLTYANFQDSMGRTTQINIERTPDNRVGAITEENYDKRNNSSKKTVWRMQKSKYTGSEAVMRTMFRGHKKIGEISFSLDHLNRYKPLREAFYSNTRDQDVSYKNPDIDPNDSIPSVPSFLLVPFV